MQASALLPRILGKLVRTVPVRFRRPVFWGSLRRKEPYSRLFALDRGLPICWYYIRKFLAANSSDIRGNTLEIADATYTEMFGGPQVTQADVLHLVQGSPGATVYGDLTVGDTLESNRFDCVILTQTLNTIYDVQAAVRTVHRILKPGGVVLATLPGISQISRYDMDRWGDYWRFTTASAAKLFEIFTDGGEVRVESHGNVAASVAYLQGLAVEDLGERRLNQNDRDYQLLITVRAVKRK